MKECSFHSTPSTLSHRLYLNDSKDIINHEPYIVQQVGKYVIGSDKCRRRKPVVGVVGITGEVNGEEP
jgi:hypothetical protein